MHDYIEGSIPNPAAGADLSVTLSTNEYATPQTLRVTLTTAVAVANRSVHFQYVNKSGQILHEVVAPAVAASQTITYTLIASTGYNNTNGTIEDGVLALPLASLKLPPGTKLITKTTNLQAADTFTAGYYTAHVGDDYDHLRLLEQIAANVGNGS